LKRRGLNVVLLAATAALGAGWVLHAAQRRTLVERGDRLFHGEAALAGRIVGHAMVLPASVARCMNCHETRSSATSAAASAVVGQAGGVAGRYGPALDHATLAQPRARRGGPPSRYDAPALCALLRTGIDPAQVMIPQTMPHYDIADADCAALWGYLISR
jgi:hypothetical protein